jgi:REP element-mobilizing transposase RayT
MPRKLRLEEVGGLYHVINRGNYRYPVFHSVGAAAAFEQTLWDTLGRFNWRLHGYALMPNHFHLAVETPLPNLSTGMHWLECTYATRFNRFRSERGHVFQGRYQALRIENGAALARVVDYIHLNPVRAKLISEPHLVGFRWSSLGRLVNGNRPLGLVADLLLSQWGLPDEAQSWLRYVEHLRALAADAAEQKRLGFDQFSRGWAIGTAGWKRSLAKELRNKSLIGLAHAESLALREARWLALLDECLACAGKTEADLKPLSSTKCTQPWCINIADKLHAAGAPYAWLAKKLCIPKPNSLRVKLFRMNGVSR